MSQSSADRIAALKKRKNFLEVENEAEQPKDYAVHGLTGKPGNATKEETRDARLVLRCTTGELEWWKIKAQADGYGSLSELTRRLLDDY